MWEKITRNNNAIIGEYVQQNLQHVWDGSMCLPLFLWSWEKKCSSHYLRNWTVVLTHLSVCYSQCIAREIRSVRMNKVQKYLADGVPWESKRPHVKSCQSPSVSFLDKVQKVSIISKFKKNIHRPPVGYSCSVHQFFLFESEFEICSQAGKYSRATLMTS